MAGFWSSETLGRRLDDLINPPDPARVANGAYELSLGAEVFVTGEEVKTKRTLAMDTQIRIPPGQFANLLTEEKVTIPSTALGLISIRFRYKQRGLINVSGFHVDPGYSGRLLFSVYNAGPAPVVLSRGTATFLLWLCDLDQPTKDLYPKSGRVGITDEDVSLLQGEIATPQALATRISELENRQTVLETRWNGWRTVGLSVLAGLIIAFFSAAIGYAIHSSSTTGNQSSTSSTTTSTAPPRTTTSLVPPRP